MDDCSSVGLFDGGSMPSVGLGLWKIDNTQTADLVYSAIKCGYRHLDAACDYGNERQAGEGIRRAISDGLCKREELWVTSKLWNTYHRGRHVAEALERSLADLGLEYLDLYLVHFPIALQYVPLATRYPPGWLFDPEADEPKMVPDSVPISETWSAMEQEKTRGSCRYIGISNFGCSLIRDLLSYASTRPAVLQVESHPFLVQEKLLRFCQQEQIAYTAFSPLGANSYVPLGMATPSQSVLERDCIRGLAAKYNKSPAQIVLRWGVQRGTAVVPKTSRVERLEENLSIFDFQLSREDMQKISDMDCGHRFNDPGVFCESAFGCFFPIYE
ncbi:MAG: aldo/keto reductase [Planctomycetales bacterium]|nr:aldo/keto reductase [Planctomycetales bacterium]